MRLKRWYTARCDGDWEHQYGIRIETLDNPGWLVKIELTGTALEDLPFAVVADGVNAGGEPEGSRWVHCSVRNRVWHGAGDETQLAQLLELFLDWAGERAKPGDVRVRDMGRG
jgi:hypothetical protein